MPDHTTEAGAIAHLAVKAITPEILKDGHDARLIIFPDKTVRSLEDFEEVPRRQRALVRLIEAKSFIDYVKAHKLTDQTVIFGQATEAGGGFNAIIDYHNSKSGGAAWGSHTVGLALVVTPEWDRWLKNNQRQMSQEQFAEFLEDNLTDIVKPEGADLLEMAQLLQGTKGVTFKSGKSLKSGAITFQYTEAIEATGRRDSDMQVPDHFVIGLCPFVGSAGVEIKARLRFRISDSGKLSFFYILEHPSKIVEKAFAAIRSDIEGATDLPVHMGTGTVVLPGSS